MNTLEEWVGAVCRELQIQDVRDVADAPRRAAMQARILDLSRDVAHDVARPAAPLTAYLLGLAAGRQTDPETAADELAERVRDLAGQWAAERNS